MIDIHRCKFPRSVEQSPYARAVGAMFSTAQSGLPEVKLDSEVKIVLQRALRTGRIKRGFETTLDILANERRGLAKLRNKTGQAPCCD